MSGVLQAIFQNQRSFKPPPPTYIGEPYGGGYYAGQISTAGNGVADYYLIVSPKASGQTTLAQKTVRTNTPGTSSDIDGPTNSGNQNDATHPAGQFCEGLTIGGYTDWYMPARMELGVLYYYLKPGTQTNNTATGNPYALVYSTYSTSVPSQTSVTAFRKGGTEPFPEDYTWSSTQNNATDQWEVGFASGDFSGGGTKTLAKNVRAIRRVPV